MSRSKKPGLAVAVSPAARRGEIGMDDEGGHGLQGVKAGEHGGFGHAVMVLTSEVGLQNNEVGDANFGTGFLDFREVTAPRHAAR